MTTLEFFVAIQVQMCVAVEKYSHKNCRFSNLFVQLCMEIFFCWFRRLLQQLSALFSKHFCFKSFFSWFTRQRRKPTFSFLERFALNFHAPTDFTYLFFLFFFCFVFSTQANAQYDSVLFICCCCFLSFSAMNPYSQNRPVIYLLRWNSDGICEFRVCGCQHEQNQTDYQK